MQPIYSKLFPSMLKLACDVDLVIILDLLLAHLHFSAEELHLCIAIPLASASASVSASACRILGQMLKSWNFSLFIFFLHFNFAYHTNKAPNIKNLRQAHIW